MQEENQSNVEKAGCMSFEDRMTEMINGLRVMIQSGIDPTAKLHEKLDSVVKSQFEI